ncbi:MAG TPA: DUF4288 domain-containing protein [Anaerolineales bacterium]|nr:DUF4288 domain-containing protein [Anaerolineales bacterium]
MIWYVATLLMKCNIDNSISGDWTCIEQIHVLIAPSDEDAYAKALKTGKEEGHTYRNLAGETVSWEFVGLENLEKLVDSSIGDGTEIRSRVLSLQTPSSHIRQKHKLTLFQEQDMKDTTAREIIAKHFKDDD